MAKRTYPHLPGVVDNNTQSALRVLYDRVFDQLVALEAAQASLDGANDTISSQQSTIDALSRKVNSISAMGSSTSTTGGGGGAGGGSDGSDPNGEGASGCAQAGGNGHVDPLLPADRTTAGKIICGTGNEYPALADVAVDQPTRDANTEELLGRMIWHLQQHGFIAGKQQNPSGTTSGDKIAFVVDGIEVAYDVFSLNPFDQPIGVHMIPVSPAHLIPDGGVSD